VVTISCSGKFHAFNLAEQLERQGMLDDFFTTYAYRKNTLMRRFAGRVDKEEVPVRKTHTALPVAVLMKTWYQPHLWNELFDRWVAMKLKSQDDGGVFIGWSGMSLHSLRRAKALGMTAIVERGSAHIRYQDRILHEEYKKFGIRFSIDPRTVEKELKEYEEADFISIPSIFAKKSFLEYGVPSRKLILNNYGTSAFFHPVPVEEEKRVFRVVYLGSLTIQKGMIYLFQALQRLKISPEKIEAWFIGKVDDEIKSTVEKYAQPNWKFFGHVNHYDLPGYLSQCDVGVIASVQDGFGMVIPQMMGCGLPVIASTNTAGEDVIEDGKNGFIVPIRDAGAIADNLQLLYDNPEKLAKMKASAAADIQQRSLSWNDYGERYAGFLRSLKTQNVLQP
jgi:glycosyltransferase involved in cell wall biosynthesis